MIERLDGGDKPARLTFWDSFDEDGNYIDDKKEAKHKKSSDTKKKIRKINAKCVFLFGQRI